MCTCLQAADIILFDGILAFHWPQLRGLFDLKIFVDADADTRLSRRWAIVMPASCLIWDIHGGASKEICLCKLFMLLASI